MKFQEHLNNTNEILLYLTAIKKSKNLKQCLSCSSPIKVNQYFSIATTLVEQEDNVTHILQYILCKECSIKIDDDPAIPMRVNKNG